MPERYQVVTTELRTVKNALLVLFVALEAVAIAYFMHRYRQARYTSQALASEAFNHALSTFPLVPAMRKMLLVEFNIWRSLPMSLGIVRDRDVRTGHSVGIVDAGYRSIQLALVILLFLVLIAAGSLVLDGYWNLISILPCAYLFLLFNCEIYSFSNYSILDDGYNLKIPNGIYGHISIEKSNIREITTFVEPRGASMSVHRIVQPNLQLRLNATIDVFGQSVDVLNVCVRDKEYLINNYQEVQVPCKG